MEEQQEVKDGVVFNAAGPVIDLANPEDLSAVGWRYDRVNKNIIIFTPSSYTLIGRTTVNKVMIEPNTQTKGPFHIALDSVNINVDQPCISIKGGAYCRLLLNGYNYLNAKSENKAAINVPYGSSLEIDELVVGNNGYLSAQGGSYSATIGANYRESYGDITIKNGSLNLQMPSRGNGIGYSNYYGNTIGGTIKIMDGNTTIYGDYNINSVDGICGQNIVISGGRLSIDAGYGSGIALGGPSNAYPEIVITGDAEVTAKGGGYSPGIDCYTSRRNGKITIYSGVVTAHGGEGAAGIGNGNYYGGYSDETIAIYDGIVAAYGGAGGAGIGSGENGNFGTIELHGGLISGFGKAGGAGIGGGYAGKVDYIKISSYANVLAQSNKEGTFDVGDGCGRYYSGLYSGMYSGEISGLYQGRLSGLFKGEIARDYMKKMECRISGIYQGKAKGFFSGLFSGKFYGRFKPKEWYY